MLSRIFDDLVKEEILQVLIGVTYAEATALHSTSETQQENLQVFMGLVGYFP